MVVVDCFSFQRHSNDSAIISSKVWKMFIAGYILCQSILSIFLRIARPPPPPPPPHTHTHTHTLRMHRIFIDINIWIPGTIYSCVLLTAYNDVMMGAIASQITSFTIIYPTVYSDADQRKHQSSASLVFVRGSHRGPVNSPHKWPVTRKMFPFDDVIMRSW